MPLKKETLKKLIDAVSEIKERPELVIFNGKMFEAGSKELTEEIKKCQTKKE